MSVCGFMHVCGGGGVHACVVSLFLAPLCTDQECSLLCVLLLTQGTCGFLAFPGCGSWSFT